MTVEGTVLLIGWRLLRPLLDRPSCIKVIYYLQRVILLFYLAPIAVAILWVRNYDFSTETVSGLVFDITPALGNVFVTVSIVWAAGGAVILKTYLKEAHILRELQSKCCELEGELGCLWEDVKNKVPCKRKIEIYQGDVIFYPITTGFLHTTIYLPRNDKYSIQEWKFILLHELYHCHFHDILWNHIMALVRCIHWFNLPVWYFARAFSNWCEFHCDYEVCRTTQREKEYCELIFRIAREEQSKIKRNFKTIQLFSDGKIAKERIERMKRYKRMKKQNIVLTVLFTGIFIFAGGITSYGAADGLIKGYEQVYENTEVLEQETLYDMENWLQEYVEIGPESENVRIEVEDPGIEPNASAHTMNWSIENNVQKRSLSFYMSAGDSILIAIALNPADVTVDVGIIEPDGTKRYVQGSDYITHSFDLDQSGLYQVFVRNQSGQTVTTNGFYSR